jgi:multidrug efflux pump subunit AcrA (membrane-fusion protein)
VLVVSNGMTAKRSVRLGTTSDTQAVVRSGLKPGEVIVAERNIGIIANMRVTPTTAPTVKPTAHP